MPSKTSKSTTSIKSTKSTTGKSSRATRGTSATFKLSAPMYDAKGAKNGTFPLPKDIFGVKINEQLMAQAVRVYLANQRQGNANTKGRSDVNLTKAKWYRQKGTGRARHGAKSAPIFVGGGVAHGPKNRDFSLKIAKKMRNNAIISALSKKTKEGDIKVVSGFTKLDGKTKNMDKTVRKITDDKKGKLKSLLVTFTKPSELENVYRSGKNIKNLKIQSANLLTTYDILKYKNLLIMKESVDVLKELRGKTK